MPIYVVKPYQVKEEEFETFSYRFFTEEERNAGKHLGLLRNHTYLIRKKFNEGVQVKQQPPYLYKWIARFDDDIDLTQLSSLLEKIDNSNENVALLQADLEVKRGEPFRKKGIKQTSKESIVLFDVDEHGEQLEGLEGQKGLERLKNTFEILKKIEPIFQQRQFLVRGSSSFGIKQGMRLHLFAKLKEPRTRDELRAWMKSHSLDSSVYANGQMWFVASPLLIGTKDTFDKGEQRSFICGEGEIELKVEKAQGRSSHVNSEGRETAFSCSSLEALQKEVLGKVSLVGQRNEYFYWIISRAVELGVDEPFIDWLSAQETKIIGDWSKEALLVKRDAYIAYQNKILHSTPISRNTYFDGGIYRFDTTDLKNHAEDIIKLAREGRVLIAIKSDMGTGKTELMRVFREALEKEEIIRTGAYISPRRAISDANGSKVDMAFMLPKESGRYVELSAKDKKTFFREAPWVATTDISIRLDEEPRDIVIFDELHKSLASLPDDGCQVDIDYLLNEKLLSAKVIVILDADMDNELVGLFVNKAMEFDAAKQRRKAFLIENRGSHHLGRENVIIHTPAQALSFAFAQIKAGKRVFIHTDHSDKEGAISTWRRLLEEKMIEEGIEGFGAAFDADSASMEIRGDEREDWYLQKLNEGLKFTIHSPFTNYGWDLLLEEDNHFEVTVGIYTHGWSQANVIKQGGGRARRASLCAYCVWGKHKPKRGDDGELVYPDTYLDEEEAAKILEKALLFEESLGCLQKEFLQPATIKKQLGLIKPLFGLLQLIRSSQEVYRWLEDDKSEEYRYINLTQDDYEITKKGMNVLFMKDAREMLMLSHSYTNLDVSDINLENIGELREIRDGFRADMISEFALLSQTLLKEEIPRVINGSSYFNYPRIIKCLLKETYSGFERADFVGWLHTNEESFELIYSKKERMEVMVQLSRLRGLTDSIKTSNFRRYLVGFFEEHNLILTPKSVVKTEWTKLYEDYRQHSYDRGFRKSWKAEDKKSFIKKDIELKIRKKERLEEYEKNIAVKDLDYHIYVVEKPNKWLKRVCQVTSSQYLNTHYY